jgi:hypothetical protein
VQRGLGDLVHEAPAGWQIEKPVAGQPVKQPLGLPFQRYGPAPRGRDGKRENLTLAVTFRRRGLDKPPTDDGGKTFVASHSRT